MQEKGAQNHQHTFYEKFNTMAEELSMKLEVAVTMKKSDSKRKIKDKFQNKIHEEEQKRKWKTRPN